MAKILHTIKAQLYHNALTEDPNVRLEEAKTLLHQATKTGKKINVDEIGAQSGFSSRSTFYLRFARYEGMTPKKYMKLHNNESGSDGKKP
jgi:AraC-like DNA-binding protein